MLSIQTSYILWLFAWYSLSVFIYSFISFHLDAFFFLMEVKTNPSNVKFLPVLDGVMMNFHSEYHAPTSSLQRQQHNVIQACLPVDQRIDCKLAGDVKRGVSSVDEGSADSAGIQKGKVTHF